MANLVLPTKPSPPKIVNPRVLLIYSQPKAGKTTVLSKLPNNLIVDLDPLGGTDGLEALSVPARTVNDLREIIGLLYNAEYDYVTLDPLTDLEVVVHSLACELYQKTPFGKDWRPIDPDTGQVDYSRILALPKGAGYGYLRKAFLDVLHGFADACKDIEAKLILSAHIRDKQINKDGKDIDAVDINLTGKLRSLTAGWVDAIGFFRRESEEGYLSFQPTDEVLCGSRIDRLTGQDILISRKFEDGNIETYWDRIYIPEN